MNNLENKRYIMIGLGLTICAQLLVMAGVLMKAYYPIWVGQEIKVKTQPIDPRDIFRGNYAQLRYDFSDLFVTETDKAIRENEIVYVQLKPQGEVYIYDNYTFKPPESGIYLKGRLGNQHWNRKSYRATFGIEAFFAEKEEALRLERELRNRAVAVLRVAKNGQAALVRVETAKD